MSDSDLIDWEQLEMIFGEDEEELDEEMVELFREFVEDGSARFKTIEASSFESDKDQIAKESHKLKGSASNFGFVKVASLLGGIEDNIATISEEDYRRDVTDAFEYFETSRKEALERFPALNQV